MTFLFFLSLCLCLASLLPLPTPDVLKWTQQEIGVIIHFSMETEIPHQNNSQYFCVGVGGHPTELPHPDTFNPIKLSTDNWIQTAVSFGAKYAVFVTQHCSGFSSWPTDILAQTGVNYTYSTQYSNWRGGKGDIVSDFIASCKKYDVLPGFYYSLNQNFYLNAAGGRVQNTQLVPGQLNVTQEQYDKVVLAQLQELWTKHGALFELWFDGGQDIPGISELIYKTQPHAVLFGGAAKQNNIRWVGTESGHPSYPIWSTAMPGHYGSGDPNGTVFLPAESDTTLQQYDKWFWKPDTPLRSLEDMKKVYFDTVGQNTNLLLDIAPDDTGLVPQEAITLYEDFGKWIKKCFSTAIASTHGTGDSITLEVSGSSAFNVIIIRENQSEGEKVLEYIVSADSKVIAKGESIGNKRIHVLESYIAPPQKVQLLLTKSKATPIISELGVYDCE